MTELDSPLAQLGSSQIFLSLSHVSRSNTTSDQLEDISKRNE